VTERMHINASERGLIRVFAIDLAPEELAAFTASGNPDTWPLRKALGATALDPEWVDVVRPSDLGEMSLSDFLIEGPGVSASALEGDRARLDALKVPVAVLPSQAFCAQAQELTPRAPLRWIGTYAEPRAALPESPLRTSAAEGHLSPKGAKAPGPDMRRASLVLAGLIALGALALGLSALGSRQ